MPADGDDAANQLITENARAKALLTRFGAAFFILVILSMLATRFVPHPIGTTISSILQDIAVVIFACAAPFFEFIVWRLRKQLPRDGYWGLLVLLVGFAVLLPVGTILIFCATFLPALAYPSPVLIALLIIMIIGFACEILGVLIVFAQLAWKLIHLIRVGRQARIGGE